MKLSNQIKPISYLKAHAAEIVRTLGVQREPLIITQNGEAKVVVQDIDSYEQMQETVSLLKILALGSRQIEASQVQPAADVITTASGAATGSLMPFRVQLTKDAARDLEEILRLHRSARCSSPVGSRAGAGRKSVPQPIEASPARKLPDGIAGHWDSGVP